MSFSYLTIISESPAAIARLSGIVERTTSRRPIYYTPNLAVFVAPEKDTLPMPGNMGIILGPLFSRSDSPSARVGDITPQLGRVICESEGQALIDHYWGGYVAIACDPAYGIVSIIREPSGQMPCYYFQLPDGVVVTSDIESLFASGLPFPELDVSYIPSLLYSTDLPSERTAFKGLMELLPGFRMRLGRDGRRITSCWSPWDHVSFPTQRQPNLVDRQGLLYDTVKNTVQAWSSCYDRLGLGLSGGLDSSIVAASLAGGRTPWAAVTVATNEAEGDERAYARIVANALNAPLIEAFHEADAIDLTIPSAPHLPRPSGNFLVQSMKSIVRMVKDNRGIDAYFTGIGGDNLFCYFQSATPLVDRFYSEGVGDGLLRTLDDICGVTGASYWEVLRMASHQILAGSSSYRWKGVPGFLNPLAFGQDQPYLHHAWLDAPPNALPGKAVHIAMLLRIQGTLGGFSLYDDIPVISPLYSQPVMEFCLEVPTWHWCENGQNRSLARDAFRAMLPLDIVRRRTKGGPDSFAIDLIEDNKSLISKFLLEGKLAENQIIDCSAIKRALLGGDRIVPPDHILIANLVEAEAWMNHWSNRILDRRALTSA